jgi:hypothetical protein
MNDEKMINIALSEKELRYIIACGIALMQNVPEGSVATYCGFSHEQIVEFSRKMKNVADDSGIEL